MESALGKAVVLVLTVKQRSAKMDRVEEVGRTRMMRWLIIGGGAMGLLYAARLAIGGHEVQVGTRTSRQAEILRTRGIELATPEGTTQIGVQAEAMEHRSIAAWREFRPDAVMLTVKQYHVTSELVRWLGEHLPEQTPVYCTQNGIGHLERLRTELLTLQVLAAVTTEGALRTGLRNVRYTGAGELWLEMEPPQGKKEPNRQKMLLAAMEKAGIAVYLSNQMEDRMYRKLLFNCVINPLTALYGVKNGELPEDRARLAHMKALYEETATILHAAGMELHGDEWNGVLKLCRRTSDNESSMLRDIRSGRPTELAWINGGVIELAHRSGFRAPVNEEIVARIASLVANR